MRPGEERIWNALLENRDGMTFSELKNKAKLSNPSLSEYLKKLLSNGLLAHDTSKKKYFIPLGRLPFEDDLNKIKEMFEKHYTIGSDVVFNSDMVSRFLINNNYSAGSKIATLDEDDEKLKHMNNWIHHIYNSIIIINNFFMIKFIDDVSLTRVRAGEGDINLKVEYLKAMKKMVSDWIVPFYDSITSMMYLNKDLIKKYKDEIEEKNENKYNFFRR